MRIPTAPLLALTAILASGPVCAKPHGRPAPAKPSAPAAMPIQVVSDDELDGIRVSQMAIAMEDEAGNLLKQPHATALILNESRFAITSLTLRLDVFDRNHKVVFSAPFTVTQFDPPPSGAKGGRLLPDAQSWIQGDSLNPPPGLMMSNGGYWITLILAQGRPLPVERATPQETLAAACSLGDLSAVKSVLASHPGIVNSTATTPDAEPPLCLAADHNHLAVARFLMERGANIEVLDSEGHTPLYIAVDAENGAMVHLLLAHHADPLAKSKDGTTPLQLSHDRLGDRGMMGYIDQIITDASQGKWPPDDTN